MSGVLLTLPENLDFVNNEALIKERQKELAEIHKLEFMMSIIKSADFNNLKLNDTISVITAQQKLIIEDHKRLNKDHTVLDIKLGGASIISYTDKRSIQEYVNKIIKEECAPINEKSRDMESKISNLYNPNPYFEKIQNLEEKRRKLQSELLLVLTKKCQSMKKCLEFKSGSSVTNDLELLLNDYQLNQTKCATLLDFAQKEILNSAEHTTEAIKEVVSYIDQLQKD